MYNLHNDMYTVMLAPVHEWQPHGLSLLFLPKE